MADRDFTLGDEVASYSVLVFRVPFRGSFLLYLVLTGLYMAAMIGLVMALAPALRSQQVAFFVVLVFFFVPSFFVSGLVTPVYREGLRRLSSDIFPATHYMIITRGIFVKGLEFGQLLRPTAFLSGMCVGGTLIALLSFRKRLMQEAPTNAGNAVTCGGASAAAATSSSGYLRATGEISRASPPPAPDSGRT